MCMQQPWEDMPCTWKTLGVAYSYDDGASFIQGSQIITAEEPRPDPPHPGGAGDHAVIYDPFHRRWLCYYTCGGICLASSSSLKVLLDADANFLTSEISAVNCSCCNKQIPWIPMTQRPAGNVLAKDETCSIG